MKNFFLDVHQKVNLVTLNIRDKELAKEYNEARMQHYWSYIVISDIGREIILLLAIMNGFYKDRSLVPSYTRSRNLLPPHLALLQGGSDKATSEKNFVTIVLAIYTNLFFNVGILHLNMERDLQQLSQFLAIAPISQIATLVKVTLIHQANFWTVGYIVIPIYTLSYIFQIYQFEFQSTLNQLGNENYYFIMWPSYALIIQTIFTVCWLTELNRILIWFQAKEKGSITEFYEETMQNKIPIVLVSNGAHKQAATTNENRSFFESQSNQLTSLKRANSFSIKQELQDYENQSKKNSVLNGGSGGESIKILQRNQSFVDLFQEITNYDLL